jgi:hypothetical protein
MAFTSLSMTLIAPSVWWWTLSTHFEESRFIGYGKAWVSGTLRLRSLKPINGEKAEKCPRILSEKKDPSSRNPGSKKFECSRLSLKKQRLFQRYGKTDFPGNSFPPNDLLRRPIPLVQLHHFVTGFEQDSGDNSESLEMNQNMTLKKMTTRKSGDDIGIVPIRIENLYMTLSMARSGQAI